MSAFQKLPLTRWYLYISKESKLLVQGYVRQIVKSNNYPELCQCILSFNFIDDMFIGISNKIMHAPSTLLGKYIKDLLSLLLIEEFQRHKYGMQLLWSENMLDALGIIVYLLTNVLYFYINNNDIMHMIIAKEELILRLLRLINIPSWHAYVAAICDILSKIENQNNLRYKNSVLMQHEYTDRIIYGMIQHSHEDNLSSAINVVAEIMGCSDSTTIMKLLHDDIIIHQIQNQLNKIVKRDKLTHSTLKILIASSTFIENLSQFQDSFNMLTIHQLHLMDNMIICIFNYIFNLSPITKGSEHEVQHSKIQILENIIYSILCIYGNQYELFRLFLLTMIQTNESLLYHLMDCIFYKESINVRHNILTFITNMIIDDGYEEEINLFVQYGLLSSIKKLSLLLKSKNYKSSDHQLSSILTIIRHLCNTMKFDYNHLPTIVTDDNLLHLISKALKSNHEQQLTNAIFTVNNILKSKVETLTSCLLSWKKTKIIRQYINALKYLIANQNKFKYKKHFGEIYFSLENIIDNFEISIFLFDL